MNFSPSFEPQLIEFLRLTGNPYDFTRRDLYNKDLHLEDETTEYTFFVENGNLIFYESTVIMQYAKSSDPDPDLTWYPKLVVFKKSKETDFRKNFLEQFPHLCAQFDEIVDFVRDYVGYDSTINDCDSERYDLVWDSPIYRDWKDQYQKWLNENTPKKLKRYSGSAPGYRATGCTGARPEVTVTPGVTISQPVTTTESPPNTVASSYCIIQ